MFSDKAEAWSWYFAHRDDAALSAPRHVPSNMFFGDRWAVDLILILEVED